MSNEVNKSEFLWKVLERVDFYIDTVNSKAALLLAYCAAMLFGFVSSVDKISGIESEWVNCTVRSLIFVSIILTVIAMIWLLVSVYPRLNKGRDNHEAPSRIFFGDVSGIQGGRDAYVNSVKIMSDEDVLRDLAQQTFVVSKIANTKFDAIAKIVLLLVFGSILPVGVACALLILFC